MAGWIASPCIPHLPGSWAVAGGDGIPVDVAGGIHNPLGGPVASWAVPTLIQEHCFGIMASQENPRMPFPGSVVLEDFSNLKPSPFCLTVTGIGWILPKSSQKEKQVLGLSATSAPWAQGPSQGQDVRAPGLWDAATSDSSLETGSKECANSRFSPFITRYKQRRPRSLICSAQSGTVVGHLLSKAELTLLQ